MAHLTDLDLTAPADSLFSGGTVLNTWRARIDVLNDALGDITSVEADQVENLGTTTISVAQWAWFGAQDQSLISTASVDFGEVDIAKTTTLAAGGYGLRCQVTHSTTGMTGTLRGAYIVATNASFTATGTIRGAEIKSRAATSGDVGGNVTTLEGVSISSDAKNKTVTTQRGMEVILDGKSGAAVTLGVGIRIANNYQANIATTSYALQIYRDSFDYTADIQLSGGGLIGGSTGKIKMDSSGVTTLTASGNLDIGSYNFRAATLTADGLTVTRVIFAGASGLLSDNAAMTFVTDTLTVTKLGAFQATGAINFDSQNMTNVDIDSGTIGGVTLDGAIAGGDQAFTNVGDMTFAAGSILKSGATNTNTLLLAANDTTFITLTTGDTDTLGIGAFTLSGKLTAGASEIEGNAFDINGGTIGGVTFDGALTMTLGSDADGDVYYRASNVLTRLAKGTATQVLTMNAGATAPEWLAGIGGARQNLVVKVNATNPTYQIDVDADYLNVEGYGLSAVNLTIDITASEANGLDTGSETADTWYSVWVIYNPTTPATAGLLSESATTPTMPAGYTKKRRVGWVRNDDGSDFIKFFQKGNCVWWNANIQVLDSASPATTYTDVDCSPAIPPTAELFFYAAYVQDDDAATCQLFIRRDDSDEPNTNYYMRSFGSTKSDLQFTGQVFSCDEAQTIEYKTASGSSHATISILGWYDLV